MRSKIVLLAVVLISAASPHSASAQESESRIEAIAMALQEIRRGFPGNANLNLPPEPMTLFGLTRSEALSAAKRFQITVSSDSIGFAAHPAEIQLAVRAAFIEADEAKILLMRAVRQPNGTFAHTASTYAVDLVRVGGRWQIKKTYFHSIF